MSYYDVELTVTIKADSLDEAIRLVSDAVWYGDKSEGVVTVDFSPRSAEVTNV